MSPRIFWCQYELPRPLVSDAVRAPTSTQENGISSGFCEHCAFTVPVHGRGSRPAVQGSESQRRVVAHLHLGEGDHACTALERYRLRVLWRPSNNADAPTAAVRWVVVTTATATAQLVVPLMRSLLTCTHVSGERSSVTREYHGGGVRKAEHEHAA